MNQPGEPHSAEHAPDGTVIERTEVLVPGPAEALANLLEVRLPDGQSGEGLPLLWHWVYLLERPAQGILGPDGHPAHGGIPVPPGPGRRRMWAGGRVRTSGALKWGEPATRRTSVLRSTDKQGRAGPMTFVTVGHTIAQHGHVVVEEEQDIVYRAAASAGDTATPAAPAGETSSRTSAPTGSAATASTPPPRGGSGPAATGSGVPSSPAVDTNARAESRERDDWEVEISPTLLFRYSALTYNAHRIHYDRDFTRDVEGYAGLVVHGPLQATLMTEAARRLGLVGPSAQRFEYRLLSPLLEHEGLVVSTTATDEGVSTAVRDWSGRQTATGTLRTT